MFVGVARVVLRLPGARSLKDRRRVVKSYKERLKARLPVVVAELGDIESYQLATLGLCSVSGELGQCEEIIQKALGMARSLADALLIESAHEVIPFGTRGSSVRGGLERTLDESVIADKYQDE
ncbi:MAG TPA: DUF503 domain-containing protein [Polyangiaceae bacterium]|nr:DUF503 domain-containing protein [Polyangiaceae bacterium]